MRNETVYPGQLGSEKLAKLWMGSVRAFLNSFDEGRITE
jgi:hypothetical protein